MEFLVVCAGLWYSWDILGVLPETLSLLHFAYLGTTILIVSGAVIGTIACAILRMLAIASHSGSIDLAIVAWLGVLLWQPLALDVGLVPEVGEQNEEEGAVHPNQVDK